MNRELKNIKKYATLLIGAVERAEAIELKKKEEVEIFLKKQNKIPIKNLKLKRGNFKKIDDEGNARKVSTLNDYCEWMDQDGSGLI